MRHLIVFTFLAVTTCSCYYPAQVVMYNKSTSDKQVTLRTNGNNPVFPNGNDSLTAYDHARANNTISSRDYHRYGQQLPIHKSATNSNEYSFVLPANYRVIIHSSWPVSSLPWGETFIINGSDSVTLSKKGKAFRKKGGNWTYTINFN